MPLYEYKCSHCNDVFTELRSSAEMDAPIECPQCGQETQERLLSGFAINSSQSTPASNCNSCEQQGFGCMRQA
ncbi:zinc ribbon domain-containing protein [Deltaproteobacteria bacterium TL4]